MLPYRRMIIHFVFLFSLIALLIGVWSLTLFYHRSMGYSDLSLRLLWWAMLVLNLLHLRHFLGAYVANNNLLEPICTLVDRFYDLENGLVTLAILVFYLLLQKALAILARVELPQWVLFSLFTLLFLFIGGYVVIFYAYPRLLTVEIDCSYYWLAFRWLPLPIVLIWVLLLIEKRKGTEPERWPLVRPLLLIVSLFLGLELLVGALYLMGLRGAGQIGYRIAVSCFSLGALMWLLRVYLPHWSGQGERLSRGLDLEAVQKRFDLTRREGEILKLLLDGKRYKEIEASLFISLHTVKRHVYNLYKKMGVDSRHRLTLLITRLKDEKGEEG